MCVLAATRTSRAGKHLLTNAACKIYIVSPPSEYALTPGGLPAAASPEQIQPSAAAVKQRASLLPRPVLPEPT